MARKAPTSGVVLVVMAFRASVTCSEVRIPVCPSMRRAEVTSSMPLAIWSNCPDISSRIWMYLTEVMPAALVSMLSLLKKASVPSSDSWYCWRSFITCSVAATWSRPASLAPPNTVVAIPPPTGPPAFPMMLLLRSFPRSERSPTLTPNLVMASAILRLLS